MVVIAPYYFGCFFYMELRQYQSDLYRSIKEAFKSNKKIIACLPTGAGKTVIFSYLCRKHLEKNLFAKILILTHRKELLKQGGGTIESFGINASFITASKKNINYDNNVFIAMVETFNKRDIPFEPTLIIIDEAHISNFKKILNKYKEIYTIGFTATPLAATPKDPLKNYYSDIVIGKQIDSLIEDNFLCRPKQFAMQEISDKDLVLKNGEFTEDSQFILFGEKKMFDGVLFAYKSKCLNKKTLIFCCNILHSEMTADFFTKEGLEARSLTSKNTDEYRESVLTWFKNTTNAILVNCGILTTGFDEPSIECIILNRATTSIPLFLQMCGRGSRIYENKNYFTILDFGSNIRRLGGWADEREWREIFFADPKKRKRAESVPNLKKCPECFAMIPQASTHCPECNHEFEQKKKEIEKGELVEYKYTNQNNISGKMLSSLNVYELLHLYNERTLKPSYILRVIRSKGLLEDFAKLKGFKKGWIFYQSTQPQTYTDKKL